MQSDICLAKLENVVAMKATTDVRCCDRLAEHHMSIIGHRPMYVY